LLSTDIDFDSMSITERVEFQQCTRPTPISHTHTIISFDFKASRNKYFAWTRRSPESDEQRAAASADLAYARNKLLAMLSTHYDQHNPVWLQMFLDSPFVEFP
jgi:hypothetical protein